MRWNFFVFCQAWIMLFVVNYYSYNSIQNKQANCWTNAFIISAAAMQSAESRFQVRTHPFPASRWSIYMYYLAITLFLWGLRNIDWQAEFIWDWHNVNFDGHREMSRANLATVLALFAIPMVSNSIQLKSSPRLHHQCEPTNWIGLVWS